MTITHECTRWILLNFFIRLNKYRVDVGGMPVWQQIFMLYYSLLSMPAPNPHSVMVERHLCYSSIVIELDTLTRF